MEIARRLLVGDTISYAKDEIVAAIEKGEFPTKWNWYAITSTYEEKNLFYILSGMEYRHPIYHREMSDDGNQGEQSSKGLRLIGIAGSEREAFQMIETFLVHFHKSGSLDQIRQIINDW